MKANKIVVGVFLLLAITMQSCAQQNENKKEIMLVDNQNVKAFIRSFPNYGMDIQAAGIATIPIATLSAKSELYIEYAYHSEGENRNGKMTLIDKGNDRFEGSWKTIADNGNVYQGALYFNFKVNGEADGYYKFAGGDYKITIFTKKK